MTNTIVSLLIPSLGDPDLQNTLDDAFAKAANPAILTATVLLQPTPQHPVCPADMPTRPRTGYYTAKGRGPAAARNRLAALIPRNATHVLSLDAHMRFVPQWDAILLDQLARTRDPDNAVLSQRGAPMGATDPRPTQMRVNPRPLPAFDAINIAPTADPQPTYGYSAHCAFMTARLFRAFADDPSIPYWGEEQSRALRMWAAGVDLYVPGQPVTLHRYTANPAYPPTDPDPHAPAHALAQERVMRLHHMPYPHDPFTHTPADPVRAPHNAPPAWREYAALCAEAINNCAVPPHAPNARFPLR